MTALHTLQTALEVAAFVAVFWGVYNEERISRWERKFFRRIKGVIKK